ncbi:MAG: hypothetical protein SGILL_008733 [Bacillariaceae sp.]
MYRIMLYTYHFTTLIILRATALAVDVSGKASLRGGASPSDGLERHLNPIDAVEEYSDPNVDSLDVGQEALEGAEADDLDPETLVLPFEAPTEAPTEAPSDAPTECDAPIRLPAGSFIRLQVQGDSHDGDYVRMASKNEYKVKYRLEVKPQKALEKVLDNGGTARNYKFEVKQESLHESGYYSYKLFNRSRDKWIARRNADRDTWDCNGCDNIDAVFRGVSEDPDQLIIMGNYCDGKFRIKGSNDNKFFHITDNDRIYASGQKQKGNWFSFEVVE